jgi:hypothetical protein
MQLGAQNEKPKDLRKLSTIQDRDERVFELRVLKVPKSSDFSFTLAPEPGIVIKDFDLDCLLRVSMEFEIYVTLRQANILLHAMRASVRRGDRTE